MEKRWLRTISCEVLDGFRYTCFPQGVDMTVTVKLKIEITVPKGIRHQAGIKPGDRVEFRVSGRVIEIIAKLSPDALRDK